MVVSSPSIRGKLNPWAFYIMYWQSSKEVKLMIRTAILVDGGFYRKRAHYLWGTLTAEERADELQAYCHTHIHLKDGGEKRILYRIFYYDCSPITNRSVFHPLTKQNIRLEQSETFTWTNLFLEELKKRRKFALRLGQLAGTPCYNQKPEVTKELFVGKKKLSDITERDFMFISPQKGVDMRIGIDISSLAYKKQVDQIILIAGDSDFVPAAKLARREGIDFILDPMDAQIRPDLFEHIDGLESPWKKGKPARFNKK